MYRSLQASRAIAAACVVLFHLGGMYAQPRYFGFTAIDGPFAWGDAGVDFFFVLSGFIITTAHRLDFGQPRRLGGYFFKRLLRIYPTYWIIAIAVCIAAVFAPALRSALPTEPSVFLKALLLLPENKDVVGGTGSPILFVAWSLQYEMLFYVVVACFIAGRAAGGVVAAALAINWSLCHFGSACSFPQSFFAGNFLFLFVMGVACAYLTKSRLQLPRPLAWAISGFVLFVAFGLWEVAHGKSEVVDRLWFYGLLSSVIILGLTQAETRGHLVLPQRWIALLGDASYSLYLLHIPVLSLVCKLFVRLHVSGAPAIVASFVAAFLICVGCSVLFYLWIERPILRYGRTLIEKRRAGGRPDAAIGLVP
jgi:exopolysaccharide production protein ExoZ